MSKIILLIIFLCFSNSLYAIDKPEKTKFEPKTLIGQTIIIPTYNGGDSKLSFVYDVSVLQSREFTYKNFSSVTVLGRPIKIMEYHILNEGKKNEILCLVVRVDNQTVVLGFPMRIKKTDFTGSVIADLFYGKGTRYSSYTMYCIQDINLRYYMADDVQAFNDDFLNTDVYLMCDEDWIAGRKYKFSGFSFLKEVNNIFGYRGRSLSAKDNNLDLMHATFIGEGRTDYILIQENNRRPDNNYVVAFTGLRKLVLSERQYINTFKPSLDASLINSIRNEMIGKELFFHKSNERIKGLLLSKTPTFAQYKEINLTDIYGYYITFSDIKQVKTVNEKGVVCYDYYLLGKGTESDVFQDYVALPMNYDYRVYSIDGYQHREDVKRDEEERIKANRERIAQLEREEREYKNSLIKKYGQVNATLILNGEVRIGFTKQMCIDAWGRPDYINNTISSYGTWEQWVYGIGSYLYFSGNKLVVIQN